MSDNDAGDLQNTRNEDLPKWVWDIIDNHGLANRVSSPLDVAVILLIDAASLLENICIAAFRENALSDQARSQIAWCKTMIADAERLYPLCSTQLRGASATILSFTHNKSRLET